MNSYTFDDVGLFADYHISSDSKFTSDVEFVVEANGYTRKDYTEFFFMNFWILMNVEVFNLIEIIAEHNIKLKKLEKPSKIFEKIYKNILTSTDNKYALAMKNLNDQIYDFVLGNRKEIVDYKQFNLPYTDVSVDMEYIYKSCIFVFEKDYVNFLTNVAKELNLDVPEKVINSFKERINEQRKTSSPKYDKVYQIITFYEEFLKNA